MEDSKSQQESAPEQRPVHAEAHHAAHEHHQPSNAERANSGKRINTKNMLSYAKPWLIPAILTAILCLVIALAMFYPITGNITSAAPGSGGDTYIALWDIWWVNYATFTLHTSIFYTNMLFWPLGANLAYQTMAPIGALLVGPLTLISIPFAYNAFFFMGYALAGFTMFLLAYYLTGNKWAALIAAVFFSFSAFHIAEAYSHIDWVNIAWIPLAFLFLLKLIKDHKKLWPALGLAVSFVLITFMGDIEQAIMMAIALVVVVVAFLLVPRTRPLVLNKGFVAAFVVFVVLTLVIGSPGFLPMIKTILQPGGLGSANFLNDFSHNELWSADVLAFFLPSQYNGLLSGISGAWSAIYAPGIAERTVYIGYVALALLVYGIWKQWKQSRLWIGIGVIFGLMALGPYVQIGTYLTPIPGIYQIYHALPFINVIREPGRFDLIATVAVSVLAAFGAKELFERAKNFNGLLSFLRDKRVLAAIILALFLFESNGLPTTPTLQSQVVTQISVSPLYHELANVSTSFSVLTLPILPNYGNATLPQLYVGKATYYTAISNKPIIGGDITRENETQTTSVLNVPLAVEAALLQQGNGGYYSLASPVSQNLTNQTILSLYNYNTDAITVQTQAYNQTALKELETYLYDTFGNPVYSDSNAIAFSTARAINTSLYKSYVAYPDLTEWQETSTFVNGTSMNLWTPAYSNATVSPGGIVVYAPYPGNRPPVQEYLTTRAEINATIDFQAFAQSTPTTLYIKEEVYGAAGSTPTYQNVAAFNLTGSIANYSATMPMVSGPYGNLLFFVYSESNYQQFRPVWFSNIRFS